MNDRHRQTEFLRQCLLYDDSSESHKLVERTKQLQRNERCIARGVWLILLMGALAFAGLAYLAIFMEDFPENMPGFVTRFLTQVCCVAALSSLICAPTFLGLGWIYRQEQAQVREECRRRAAKLLESRLGEPCATTPAQVVKQKVIEPITPPPDPDPDPGQGAAGAIYIRLTGHA
jgi:hypothetical protein